MNWSRKRCAPFAMFFLDALEDIFQMLRLLSERSGALAVAHEFGPELSTVLFTLRVAEAVRASKIEGRWGLCSGADLGDANGGLGQKIKERK